MSNAVVGEHTEQDLTLEKIIDAPPSAVWQAWSDPELIKEWFCPKPWGVSACEIDLRPGGAFNTTMRSPEGQEFPNSGCFLEVREQEKLVFTDALTADFRPAAASFMTAIITLTEQNGKTLYSVRVLHKNAEDRQKHEAMGFREGWGITIDQLEAVARRFVR